MVRRQVMGCGPCGFNSIRSWKVILTKEGCCPPGGPLRPSSNLKTPHGLCVFNLICSGQVALGKFDRADPQHKALTPKLSPRKQVKVLGEVMGSIVWLMVKPYTPHPSPHTPHPTPHTLRHTPFTLHPAPTHSNSYTLHPKPYTLHPNP